MARSPSESPSQEGSTAQVKREKSTRNRTKQDGEANGVEEGASQATQYEGEREPSLAATQEVDASQTQQEENGADGSEDGEDEERTPNGRKRQRINERGDSAEADVKDEAQPLVRTLLRDPADNYVVGSVVRMHLHNFVTYDDAEFRPGPYLNMVLGPNGTGKSTIACALCLGLGFPPSTLGRQTTFSQFVKANLPKEEICFVEVELKGPIGKNNTIIRRTFNRTNNGTSFLLDGRTAAITAVQARMSELNIRVNNLCSFLPQDKVAEFARMSSQELLKETEKAAGDPRLMEWHETLSKAGKDLQQFTKDLGLQTEELDRLRQLQERDSHEVELFNEKQAQERLLQRYSLFHMYHSYYEKKRDFWVIKKATNKKRKEILLMNERNRPINDFEAKLTNDQKKAEKLREKAKAAMEQTHKNMMKKNRENDELERSVEDLQSKLHVLKKTEKNHKALILRLRDEVNRAELRAKDAPEEIDEEALKAEKETFRPRSIEVKDQIRDVQEKLRESVEAYGRYDNEINNLNASISRIQDKAHQRLDALRRWDPDCAEVVRWLRDNRSIFRQEVFEPAFISLSVPNQRYAPAIETCLNANQFKTFVTTCEDDYRTFTRLVTDSGEAIGRRARVNVWFRQRSQLPPPPLSGDEMRQQGFDGYAIDFVDCPDGLKWYLQKEVMLHRTAVKLDDRVDNDRMANLIARGDFGAGYIAGRTSYRVTKSAYGKRLPQTMSFPVKPPRNLGSSHVDPEIMRDLDRKIADARESQENVSRDRSTYTRREEELLAERDSIAAQVNVFTAKIDAYRKAQAVHAKNKLDWEDSKKRLKVAEDKPPPQEEMQKIKSRILKTAVDRIQIAKAYKELIVQSANSMRNAVNHALKALHIGANIKAVAELKETYQRGYNAAVAEYTQLEARYRDARTSVKELQERVQEAGQNANENDQADLDRVSEFLSDHLKNYIENGVEEPLPEGEMSKTADDYQTLMIETQARIDAALVTNPGVVERYQQREEQIARDTVRLEKNQRSFTRKQEQVKQTKERWQPALQRLVDSINDKFSTAFDHIGCAGEIHIKEDEDYEKWAIEIFVKFRDKDELQRLNAQTQSGGERALSTIMYLMSLTDLARSPFSLVDEINQGMDHRAEREVHNQLVKVACAEHSGQYFLITPKLLPALNYHERMKILCVNNGEWVDFGHDDEEGQRPNGSMMHMLEETLRRRTAAAA